MAEIITSKSENDTANAAHKLAGKIKSPCVILLNGTLGMGKTVFARSLIRSLCQNPSLEVVSPTFTLVQNYEAPDCDIHHYDLYRLKNPDEILELGWEDHLYNSITIIEWPERLGPFKPAQHLDITISNSDNAPDHRNIRIEEHI